MPWALISSLSCPALKADPFPSSIAGSRPFSSFFSRSQSGGERAVMKSSAYQRFLLTLLAVMSAVFTCRPSLRSQPLPGRPAVPQTANAVQARPRAPRPSNKTKAVTDRGPAEVQALRQIRILPSSITLSGPRASQRFLIEGEFEDGHWEDVTSKAKFSCSNLQVAAVDPQHLVQPKADGEARL